MRAERFELSGPDPAAAQELAVRIRSLAPAPPDVAAIVAEAIAAVGERGDEAVRELGERYDPGTVPAQLRVPNEELKRALREIDADVRAALQVAAVNIRAVAIAEAVARPPVDLTLPAGQRIDLTDQPVASAGAYVPGGRAPYPSTVLMCCIPARTAGVERIAVATPPGEDGLPHTTVLAACAVCGVDEVYAMGGAHGIAALALGTETVRPVNVVVGPGSPWVQEAKRQLVGRVGIDGLAGPSEVFVIADETAGARDVALDLAAQGEHGPDSLLVLATPDVSLLDEVVREVAEIERAYATVADAPLALVAVPSIEAAVALANAFASEHLELQCAEAEEVAHGLTTSACIFTGAGGVAFGDYVAGSNHVLPTGGSARFGGPLGIATFRRRQALVSLPAPAASALAPHVGALARAEGFPVHGASAESRSAPTGPPTGQEAPHA